MQYSPSYFLRGGRGSSLHMRIYNKIGNKDFRKILRQNLTSEERKVWNIVRNRKILNCKFFRQYGIGVYTADFYCPECHVAIEIDGGQHNTGENLQYDEQRTQYFNSLEIQVVRFWNNEINGNMEGVYQKIYTTIQELKENSPRPSL